MSLFKLLLSISLLGIGFGAARSQGTPKATMVDEVGLTCSEDLMARYDYFVSKLSSESPSRGLIIFFGDRSAEGRNLELYRWLSQFYPDVRQMKSLNLEFVRAPDREDTKIQFWIIPPGAQSPEPDTRFVPQPIESTTRYDVAAADFHKVKGRTHLFLDGFYELGCDFGPNNVGFVDLIRKHSDLTGYLVVYTEFGKGKPYADRMATFAVKNLLKNFRISRSRIKTLFGGNRNRSEIELWLVPNGGEMPSLRPYSAPSTR